MAYNSYRHDYYTPYFNVEYNAVRHNYLSGHIVQFILHEIGSQIGNVYSETIFPKKRKFVFNDIDIFLIAIMILTKYTIRYFN